MPAPWEKYQQQSAQPGPWSKYQPTETATSKPAPKPEPPGFFERGYDATIGAIVGTGKEILSKGAPRVVDEMGTAIKNRYVANPQQTNNPFARATDAVVGPVVDLVAEDIKSGNYLGAAGTVGGNVAMLMLPALFRRGRGTTTAAAAPVAAESAPSAYAIEGSKVKGPMAQAVEYADKQSIPVTKGERMNSRLVQKMERMSEMVPGSSSVAEEFYASRNQQVIGKAKGVLNRMGGAAEDNTAAAQAVIDRIQGRTTDLRDFYRKKYDSVEKSIERNQAKLQAEADTQFKAEERAVKLENANTLAKWIQENKRRSKGGYKAQLPEPELKPLPERPVVIAAEVNLKPIQEKLRTFYDELTETMPQTQREASPGYARLKAIVEDPNPSKAALDLDRDLSEIKRVLRDEQKGYAATKSGRYAAATINAIESELQAAIEKAGGAKAVDNLLKARRGVREMHMTLDALEDLLPKGESPAKLFDKAVSVGDRELNKLMEIRKRAPQAVKEIGATYLDGALQKLTGEAGQADMTGAVNQWKRLGPRTKVELFGKQTAAELDAFFENAPKLIKNINKSDSAYSNAAFKALTSGGLMVSALTGGLPGLVGGVATAAGGAASSRAIANFLFKPGNAKLLQDTMRFTREPNAGKFFMNKLNKAVESDPELLALLQSARTDKQAQQPNQQ